MKLCGYVNVWIGVKSNYVCGYSLSVVDVQDKRVNWHSTPFVTRLDRALNTGSAEA